MEEPPLVANNFTINKQWFTLGGEPTSMDKVTQGELILVTLQGRVSADRNYRALLVDLLPAGFEIERPRVGSLSNDYDYDWLPPLSSPRFLDGLDDRFVAAYDTDEFNLDEENVRFQTFHAAYLVRAVTPGTYTVPPAEIEGMYRPENRARTGAGVVTIRKR